MIENNLTSYRERERESNLPITLIKLKKIYSTWLGLYRNFPKVERLGIGHKIDQKLITILEVVFLASFTSPAQKLPLLSKTIIRLDTTKFFMQLAWENKLLTTEKYSAIIMELETVGGMLYKWKNDAKNKTLAMTARET